MSIGATSGPGGLSFAWSPGTAFEYSNLGYAILGRVVAVGGGAAYRDVVADTHHITDRQV